MLRRTTKLSPALMRNISLYHRRNKRFDVNGNSDFASKVINCRVPVIVDFHAEWCEPCRILTSKLVELLEPMENVHLALVDVEYNPELVDTFEVKAVPAVIAISNGLIIDKFIGLAEAHTVENLVERLSNGEYQRSTKEETGT